MKKVIAALKDLFTAKEFHHKMLHLAVPIALSGILSSSLQIIDTLMIAQLGDVSVAAVGLANRLTFLLSFLVTAVTSGSAIFAAQYWGERNENGLKRAFGLGLSLMVPIDVLFAIVAVFFPQFVMNIFSKDPQVIAEGCAYLRVLGPVFIFQGLTAVLGTMLKSTERPRLPMIAGTVSISLNVVLNYVLIFGKLGMPALGAQGAAIATLISAVVEIVLLAVLARAKKAPITLSLSSIKKPDTPFLKKFMSTTIPVFVNEVGWGMGVLVTTWVYSTMGTAAAASASIYETIKSFIIIICVGIGNSGGILVGIDLGAGKLDEAQKTGDRMLILGVLAAWLACPILLLLIPQLLKLYNELSPEAVGNLRVMLSVLAIFLWIKMCNYNMVNGIMRAGGDTKAAAMIDVGNMWCVSVLLVFIFGYLLKWPIVHVFPFTFIGDFTGMLCGLYRYRQGKWKKRLT